MNMRVTPHAPPAAGADATRPRKTRFHPRLEILDEVVAGLLWLQLDLPDDVSRAEIERFARRLVARIKAEPSEAVIESELMALQRRQLCRPANPAGIRDLARRSMMAVKGA